MKKILFSINFALLTLFASCSNSKQVASDLYDKAQTAYEQGMFNDAKLLIDSIENNHKDAIDIRKESQLLKYRIELAIEENTLHETDSLLQAILPKINETTEKYFDYQKSEYDDLGHFMYKGSEVESNVQRSYIHAEVDEYGVTQLISTYSGGSNIDHTSLKIVASDGSECVTQTIPYNDGSNYHYDIDGTKYESVTYQGEKDNGALGFIALNSADNGLSAVLLGGNKDVKIAISAKEREALAASYELGKVLAEQLLYTQQNKVAAGKISYLKEKIDEKTRAAENN